MGDVLTTKGTKNALHLKGIICFHKKTLKLKKKKSVRALDWFEGVVQQYKNESMIQKSQISLLGKV